MEAAWHLLRSRSGAATWNMALDEALLSLARRPTLRLYSWSEPAATFGYFQKFEEVAVATELRPLIRRCTGGGIVPHDRDWTYSLVFPAGTNWYQSKAEQSYQRVHEWVAASFTRLGLSPELAGCCEKSDPGRCFAGFEKHDVLIGTKKIAGAAQRRTRSGLLIQGSIQPPPEVERERWESVFLAEAVERFEAHWEDLIEDEEIRTKAESLEREKYSTAEYNRRK